MKVAGNAVGIDLGKKTHEDCFISPEGKKIRSNGKTDFNGIERLCEKLHKDDAVAMEACSLAFRIERTIREKVGCKVYILNPAKLAVIFMTNRKTDREDSMKLAKLLRSHEEDELPVVTPPTDEEMNRRKLISEYRSLKSKRTKEINRLHAIFEHNGFTQFVRKDMCVPKNRQNILPLLNGYEQAEGKRLEERLELLEKQIAALEQRIQEESEHDDKVQKLTTIPGIGNLTALTFVAYVGDVNRFENRHQVSNFIGFVPKVDRSCTINRLGHITKQGNPILRSLLVQAAWSCVRSKSGGALKEKYKYMSASRGIGSGKSIVTIARKLGELMYTLLKTEQVYEPKKFISPEQHCSSLAKDALFLQTRGLEEKTI